MWLRFALTWVFVGMGAGCSVSPGDLDPPVFTLNVEDGLCGSNLVVDAHRDVYSESGCEG